LQAAVLSALCVMFQVQLSFVVNLSNVFLAWLSNISLNLLSQFRWLQLPLVLIIYFVFHIHCISVHKLLYFSYYYYYYYY
jgi:hypothetical protein